LGKISNIQKERELLGCFLLSRESINTAIENNFMADECVDDFNRKILENILQICRNDAEYLPTIGSLIDNLEIKDKEANNVRIKLNRYKKMIQREIINDNQIIDITRNNILELRDLSIKRKIIYVLKNGLERIDIPAREFASALSKDIMAIEMNDGLVTEVDIYTGFQELKELMEYQRDNDIEFGFSFGLRDFDIMIQDQIAKATLTYIVGRPSNYKSGLALNLSQNIAMNGIPVALLSNEMEIKDVYRRMLSRITRIEMRKLKKPKELTNAEWQKLDEAIKLVKSWPLFVINSSRLNIGQLDSTIAYLKAKYGIQIVFQDYMQLIRTRKGNIPSEEYEFGQISEELRMIAKTHDIALISLTQANRGPEQRDDKRPTLRDIRNSGKLEQDAHNIFYVYRDEFYYGPKSELPNHLEIGALKIREGELKKVILHFDGARATLNDADELILMDKTSDYIGGGLFGQGG
jgi:replicative DNA helicase